MKRAENKASRLLDVEALLLAHPEGLTQSKVGQRLGVNSCKTMKGSTSVRGVGR